MKEKNDIFEGKTYDYQTIVSNYDVQVGLKTIKNAGGGAQKTNYEIEILCMLRFGVVIYR